MRLVKKKNLNTRMLCWISSEWFWKWRRFMFWIVVMKVFDTMVNTIVVYKMFITGIRGVTHQWFWFYLTGWKQRVSNLSILVVDHFRSWVIRKFNLTRWDMISEIMNIISNNFRKPFLLRVLVISRILPSVILFVVIVGFCNIGQK